MPPTKIQTFIHNNMKTFQNFLESDLGHQHHLNQIQQIIDQRDNQVKKLGDKVDQLSKALAKIKVDLERGLKDKTKLNDAIYNSINLARSLTPYSKTVDDLDAQGGWRLKTVIDPELSDSEKVL